ncbi:hypothetical protein [Aquimarina longa]|uniref:hypothetical protein n=1 Tax=Aquimarina longa TaxID=1080221 RepID=UPI0007823369|nr:hypothetical protein [Aquimarina longa]
MHIITWDVANTNANGINTAIIDILLSRDGGNTYPENEALIRNVRNNRAHEVRLPRALANNYKIMVKPVGNIFFNIIS